MTTLAKEQRSRCRAMTDAQLQQTIAVFPNEIRRAQSLLAAARRELDGRNKKRSKPCS